MATITNFGCSGEKRTFLDLYDFKLPSVVLKLTALLLIVITSDLKILDYYFKKRKPPFSKTMANFLASEQTLI